MKTKINHIFIFTLFALLSFTACQDEITEVNNPTAQETIVANSTLSNLMRRTSANFGASDDFLDGSNCFSIELPVTIIVNDVTIIIETEADLEQLQDLFEDNINDEDFSDFVFPITIIFSDYSQIVIENEDQLQSFVNQCDEDDDNIECVDFVFPISFSVFNSQFNLIDTIIIENDEALYNFLNGLEDDENPLIVSLNYPVTLEYANGETIEVTTNQELAEAIEAASDNCEDENNCTIESAELNLKECQWELALYSSFPEFQGFLLEFNSDYTFNIILDENQVLSNGNTWSLVSNDNGDLSLALTTEFEDLGGEWLIVECDDDRIEFTKNNNTMVLEQDCEGDLNCSLTDMSSILQECPWDFSDGSGNFVNNQMVFNENGVLQITEGLATSAIGGAWSLSATDNGIILNFSELTAFQDRLGGDWLIVECDDNRIEIVRGETTFVLEKDCEGDSQFNLQETNALLLECYWPFVTSLYDNVVGEILDFQENNVLQIINSVTNQVQETGTWNLSVANNNLILTIDLSQNTMISLEWIFTEFEDNRFVLNNGNDTLTIEQDCDSFNNPFNCFSNFELVECENANGEAEFNLSADTVGLILCPVSFTASFHTTQADAEANVEEIVNTESYSSGQAEVYLRIEADNGNFEIFSIFLNTEECIDFDCYVNTEISSCSQNNDGFATFNLTEANSDCGIYAIYGIYYYESESDALESVNPISTPESYTNLYNPSTIYAAIVNVNNNVIEHIFTITLIPENCNPFECFQSFDAQLEVCDNGTDGPYEFNLPIAFSNCTPSADVVTYHVTQADAETGVNAIANPSAYATANVSSTIYTRVEIGSQFEVFPIQLSVVDCNETCSETDVDGFLLECIWNVVNYNGSDNLIAYNFDFEASNQIVVIYTDTLTIDATWSTSQTDNGVIVEFSNVSGPNIQAITGEWLVVECDNNRLELHRGDDTMVLERTCD